MRTPMSWAWLAAAALSATAPAARARPARGAIEVRDAWSRPTGPGAPVGVAYLTLANRGRSEDRLIGASTPLASGAGLHRSSMQGGVMSMQAVPDGLPVPAGGSVKLEPGGYHLMLTGLKRALRPGDRVPLTLRFRRAGKVATTLDVRAAPPETMHMHMP